MTASPGVRPDGPTLLPPGFRRFLLGDPAFWLGLGVWLACVVPPLLPQVSDDLSYYLSVFASEPPILAALVVIALFSGRTDETPAERRFRHLLAGGVAAWLAVRMVYLFVGPEGEWTLPMELGTDVLYLGLYFCVILAVSSRPHRRRYREATERLWSMETAATLLLGFGLIAYFVVLPATVNRELYGTWIPSLFLFTLLDLAVLARAATEWAGAERSGWRATFGWIAVTAAFWTAGDGVEALMLLEAIPWVDSGTLLDLLWWAPHLTLLVVLRSRAWDPEGTGEAAPGAEEEPGTEDEPAGVRVPAQGSGDRAPALSRASYPVAYAFVLPLAHFLVQALDLMDPVSLPYREICVLVFLGLMASVAVAHERLLQRETDRLEEAQRRTREAMESTRRLEAVGRLAAGIAHDFNNLLMVVRGRAEMIRDGEDPADARADAREIIDAAGRGSRLVDHLLTFGRRDRERTGSVDLGTLLPEMEALLERLLPTSVELDVRAPTVPLPVPLGSGQMEQVILNLALNARDAVGPGGWIRVEAYAEDDPSDGARRAVVRVSDGGEGMSPEAVERVFEPFFTTKELGGGTGLGLSTVHGLVEEIGGSIDVESEVGRGTVVTVRLPLAEHRSWARPDARAGPA